uniref:MMPL family transporter n=1 Tax=Herbidospora sakaeratensis TaxID=564415 RepID=UPI00078554B5|nr:MMPL family transporter [Herbidospora sakaeratensis]
MKRAWLTLAIWLVLLAGAGMLSGKLEEVRNNDPSAYLPASAESTQVEQARRAFAQGGQIPAIIVWEDKSVEEVRESFPRAEASGNVVRAVVPLEGGDLESLTAEVDRLRELAGPGAYVTGPAGQSADAIEVFGSIDLTLLIATSIVVIVVLLLTYRGPLLWLIPFFSAGAALVSAQAGAYLLARYADFTVSGQSGGILLVLVFGIATDYALLLVARYREELTRHENRVTAMTVAWKRAAPAIVASAATVVAALLCLLAADQSATRGLGPVCAAGVVCALVAMLTLLPALLVLVPRGVFWPRIPRYGTAETSAGIWTRIGTAVARRPRRTWIITTVVLAGMAATLSVITIGPLADADTYRGRPDSVIGAELLAKNFPATQDGSLVVIAPAGQAAQVKTALEADPGVTSVAEPVVAGPNALINGSVTDPETVERLREIPGAQVGGTVAEALDAERASEHDARLIIPLILVVIVIILGILLRAVVAPLLVIATVVLSFAATLGVSGLIFTHVFGFAATETGVPLLAFVFLVAVGVDYNIFLITRVREETAEHGTRKAALIALSATGGVITSAGVVLAATFAVLGVLPLVVLAEIGFIVAFGVLLDTFVVRSVLLTALTIDAGDRIWWPSRLGSKIVNDRHPLPSNSSAPAR